MHQSQTERPLVLWLHPSFNSKLFLSPLHHFSSFLPSFSTFYAAFYKSFQCLAKNEAPFRLALLQKRQQPQLHLLLVVSFLAFSQMPFFLDTEIKLWLSFQIVLAQRRSIEVKAAKTRRSGQDECVLNATNDRISKSFGSKTSSFVRAGLHGGKKSKSGNWLENS